MAHDVAIIGGGTAGLTAAALLADEGERVVVLEPTARLGGFSATYEDEGFLLNHGGHLLEDPGSGLTRVFERLGLSLGHATPSDAMPVWDHVAEEWSSVRDRHGGSRDELKRVIDAVLAMPYEELGAWDDRCLREWLVQHTDDSAVIELFEFLAFLEFLTEHWWDHSASDSLFVRKIHLEEQRTIGYSFWPAQGWQGMIDDLAGAVTSRGGMIRTGAGQVRVTTERGSVRGVAVERDTGLPNAAGEHEMIEADAVIVALPVWRVSDVIPRGTLPDWYQAQLEHLSQPRFRDAWIGVYLATEEPCPVLGRRELAVWERSPRAGLPGFLFEQTAYDPGSAPAGRHLYVAGAAVPGERVADGPWIEAKQDDLEADLKQMYPGLQTADWRRRHVVFDPSIGVMSKPMLVGRYRPRWRAPNVDELLFAHETFRSRGVEDDRAARAALTVVEDLLGSPLAGFDGTWRYGP